MSRAAGLVHIRVVALLLLLEATSVTMLWTLDPLSEASQTAYALFLGISLISFAMISYVYRTDKRGDLVSRAMVLAGCSMILVLVFAALFIRG